MDSDQWLQLFLGVLVVAGSLGGVWLGTERDRKSRREERKTNLRDTASTVLGETYDPLVSIDPESNAGLAEGLDVDELIASRRREADEIRPQLAVLSVLWPAGRKDLTTLMRFIRYAPTRLEQLLRLVLLPTNPSDVPDYAGFVHDYQEALATWERAVARLDDEASE